MFKGLGTQGDLNGFLDAGSLINGELRFEDTFRVDGKIVGKVVSEGELIVGEKGDVDGEIRVRRVYVSGTVKGQVHAEKIEITPAGRVMADLFAPTLVIEAGAFFEGTCSMKRAASVNDRPKIAQLSRVKET